MDVYYDKMKQQLICVIADEGLGFREEEQQNLFKLFKTPTEQVLERSN
jgi:signal transduction histidine kinase